MAKLFEYQSKEILQKEGIKIPKSFLISSVDEINELKDKIKFPVVVKGQIYIKGRANRGLIKFANDLNELKNIIPEILNKRVDGFTIEKILIEEKIQIKQEMFCASLIDDTARSQVIIFSSVGGSGIEEILRDNPSKMIKYQITTGKEVYAFQLRDALDTLKMRGSEQNQIAELLVKLYKIQKKYDGRSIEINPLVLTADGEIIAVDCHMVIDDYAVFRQPTLAIDIAREFDRPPTELEKIAYKVEKGDYRGTFYFIQMGLGFKKEENYIGFHGAGGGGSMMSMDAVLAEGFKIANFCDTSGNPPASKVYRAGRIILSQNNLVGYFGSGSGVASQEQYHSARGLLKAFLEADISIPAVIRLGGNKEEMAIEILTKYTTSLPTRVECYGKSTPASYCAKRLKELVFNGDTKESNNQFKDRKFMGHLSYSFDTVTNGNISFYYEMCNKCQNKICIGSCQQKILQLSNEVPVLAISQEEAKRGKCTECLACELECFFHGGKGLKIELPITGLL